MKMTNTEQNIMHPVIRTLYKTASLNSNSEEMLIFNSPELDVAYAGSRKYWGGSDLFMRYHGDTKVKELIDGPAVYNIADKVSMAFEGLLGRERPDGKRELFTPEVAHDLFVKANEKGWEYSLKLNPKALLDFIEPLIQFSDEHTKTISIMPSALLNASGHSVGFIRKQRSLFGSEERVFIETPSQEDGVTRLRIENSLIDITEDLIDKPIMFNYLGETADDMAMPKIGEVIMEYKPGVNVSIQDYPSGHILPIFDSFSVIRGEDGNSLNHDTTQVLPFIENQDKKSANSAPLLTFALPTFLAVLNAMEGYREMELMFNDSINKCYVTSVDRLEEVPYHIEALIAPIMKYKYGKILTY